MHIVCRRTFLWCVKNSLVKTCIVVKSSSHFNLRVCLQVTLARGVEREKHSEVDADAEYHQRRANWRGAEFGDDTCGFIKVKKSPAPCREHTRQVEARRAEYERPSLLKSRYSGDGGSGGVDVLLGRISRQKKVHVHAHVASQLGSDELHRHTPRTNWLSESSLSQCE